jgi:serine/threonine protein kinase
MATCIIILLAIRRHIGRQSYVCDAYGEDGIDQLFFTQVIGVARGLEYLHSKEVVHGDLKAVRLFVIHERL